jgi:hypothetical protein
MPETSVCGEGVVTTELNGSIISFYIKNVKITLILTWIMGR